MIYRYDLVNYYNSLLLLPIRDKCLTDAVTGSSLYTLLGTRDMKYAI